MNRLLPLLAIFVVLGGLYCIMYFDGIRHVEKKTVVFVTDAVADIVHTWSPEVYKQYVDVQPGSEKNIEAAFAAYRRLGAVVHTPVCAIKDFSSHKHTKASAIYVDASYECQMEFETGPALVDVTVYRLNDSFWRIRYFNIISNYFTTPQPR